ncbi:hypothetical protein [Nonomuraea zeae]|uniref:Uncharacterized protein n=1 Tax=Nonomuraea zeae TaxID=1642303 RepID=A0A5S4FZW8_9ACTN|nr:hypothetical protein [Nonomuraea zeae]TMR26256.1 hypothetical protein ETD85_43195 [Nonomuraea zeae]
MSSRKPRAAARNPSAASAWLSIERSTTSDATGGPSRRSRRAASRASAGSSPGGSSWGGRWAARIVVVSYRDYINPLPLMKVLHP